MVGLCKLREIKGARKRVQSGNAHRGGCGLFRQTDKKFRGYLISCSRVRADSSEIEQRASFLGPDGKSKTYCSVE